MKKQSTFGSTLQPCYQKPDYSAAFAMSSPCQDANSDTRPGSSYELSLQELPRQGHQRSKIPRHQRAVSGNSSFDRFTSTMRTFLTFSHTYSLHNHRTTGTAERVLNEQMFHEDADYPGPCSAHLA